MTLCNANQLHSPSLPDLKRKIIHIYIAKHMPGQSRFSLVHEENQEQKKEIRNYARNEDLPNPVSLRCQKGERDEEDDVTKLW